MDKKDKKLLAELMINSRIPINQLAKKVGISREVATYRINKLIKDKTILNFYTIINTEALGFSRFGCCLQLKNITAQKEKEFLDFLINHKFVTYLGPIVGKWNFGFDLLVKDKEHLERIIKEITNYAEGNIESFIVISIGAEQGFFPTKLMGINKEIIYNKPTKSVKLDKIDLEILRLISKNSRIGYIEMSKDLNLTPNAIKYRIKNLENSGIIQGYTISLDIKKYGYEWKNIRIKSTGIKVNLLKNFLRQSKEVAYFYEYLGNENWDLDVGIIVQNSLQLRDFILGLREKFGDVIKIHEIYDIIEESKGNYAPEGIFKLEM